MADNHLTEEGDIDMLWDVNKELTLVISCIKNVLWIKDQQDFGNKCLIRELLQKMFRWSNYRNAKAYFIR